MKPQDMYDELMAKCEELKEFECDVCARDLRVGIAHPLWMAAAIGCMTEKRHIRSGSADSHAWVRSRFLGCFGERAVSAAEALAAGYEGS